MTPLFCISPHRICILSSAHRADVSSTVVQALYGGPAGQPVPAPRPQPANLCADSSVDATLTLKRKRQTFVFRGAFFWGVTNSGRIAEGYPQLISDRWCGVPDNLDAILHCDYDETTYFFKVH